MCSFTSGGLAGAFTYLFSSSKSLWTMIYFVSFWSFYTISLYFVFSSKHLPFWCFVTYYTKFTWLYSLILLSLDLASDDVILQAKLRKCVLFFMLKLASSSKDDKLDFLTKSHRWNHFTVVRFPVWNFRLSKASVATLSL